MVYRLNIIFLTLISGYYGSTLCYNFTFSNATERIIIICYKLEGLSQSYYQIVPSDQSIAHYIANAHCFGGSILWAEHKETDAFGKALPYNGGLDLIDDESGALDQKLFKKYVANKYAFIPMQIKVVDDETYQLTAKAVEMLAEGINELGDNIIDKIIAIMKAKVAFTTLNPSKKKSKKTAPVKSSLPENNVALIPEAYRISTPELPADLPASYSASSPDYVHPVKSSFPAMYKPDLSLLRNLNTNIDIEKKTTSQRNALGKIGRYSASLYGLSRCRDLHFLILDTGEIGAPHNTKSRGAASRIKKPILIAEINQGG